MTFLQRICKTILYKRMGWTTRIEVEHPAKYILCLAPHTSNWDFIIGLLYSRAENMKINFLMKKECSSGLLVYGSAILAVYR